uniref:Uncharacterized protein n=1 Tax=Candidatus Kentrum sp. UNK TaxID=2126344 RepID=A0A451AR39_9GAMM|nr:MAG: hypothetical protein BECKUNK1418H_GA0071006_100315 [Candidatus Kentron sp. UNK]
MNDWSNLTSAVRSAELLGSNSPTGEVCSQRRRATNGDGGARQAGVREVSPICHILGPLVSAKVSDVMKHWLAPLSINPWPSQRNILIYGYLRCTLWVFGGVAWTKWLMIDLTRQSRNQRFSSTTLPSFPRKRESSDKYFLDIS